MSWSAHLTHTPTGLAIVFAGPVSRLDLTPDVAEHFASLIAIEARAHLTGVVRTLEAQNLDVSPSRHRAAMRIAGNSNAPHGDAHIHPNCCDCEKCLNGDHDHG